MCICTQIDIHTFTQMYMHAYVHMSQVIKYLCSSYMIIVENWTLPWLNNYLVADRGLQLRLSSVTLTTVYREISNHGGGNSH